VEEVKIRSREKGSQCLEEFINVYRNENMRTFANHYASLSETNLHENIRFYFVTNFHATVYVYFYVYLDHFFAWPSTIPQQRAHRLSVIIFVETEISAGRIHRNVCVCVYLNPLRARDRWIPKAKIVSGRRSNVFFTYSECFFSSTVLKMYGQTWTYRRIVL